MYVTGPSSNEENFEGWRDFLILRHHLTMLSDLAILLQKTVLHEGGKSFKKIFWSFNWLKGHVVKAYGLPYVLIDVELRTMVLRKMFWQKFTI